MKYFGSYTKSVLLYTLPYINVFSYFRDKFWIVTQVTPGLGQFIVFINREVVYEIYRKLFQPRWYKYNLWRYMY